LDGPTLRDNRHFTRQVYIADSDIPGAGKGLFATSYIPRFTVIGIYTGGDHLDAKTVSSPNYHSDYVLQLGDQVRDAFNHHTGTPTCDAAFINDSLDLSCPNTDWYIHPEFPTLVLVLAISDIPADSQLFISYGADYWCQDRFPITTLASAIRCYDIDIHSSPQWRQLKAYPQLCLLFPPSLSSSFDPAPFLTDYVPTPAEQRLFSLLSSPFCPPDVHAKPSLVSSRTRTHHRQALHKLISLCRDNSRIHALYLQSGDLDHSHLQHLAQVLPTSHIYALNLGEAEFSANSLHFLHDFLPATFITQLYLHHHPDAKLLQRIHLRTDQNRDKVLAYYASRSIIPAEWALISTKAVTAIQYMDSYISSQSSTSSERPISSLHKRPRSELQEDATSHHLSPMRDPDAAVRIDSPTLPRNVRARSDFSTFDYAMFRDIFASRNLSDTPDHSVDNFCSQASPRASSSSSFIFSFSFDFNFDEAPTSTHTTLLPYDKKIVES
jgi:histone-lysine N-methyltransferase EZH2